MAVAGARSMFHLPYFTPGCALHNIKTAFS
ncbi:hypothetical protein PO124_27215 [Bacillus licheniformis]|nr:hypothetical protein [Bacillus licheniformis]